MSLLDFYKHNKPGRLKHQTYNVVSTTLSGAEASGQTVLSVTSTTGMSSTSGRNAVRILLDNGRWHQTTISSIGAGTITVASGLPSNAASGNTVVATGVYTFTLPAPVVESGMFFATYCGGGQGGAGGGSGGGGGGGGASCTFRDMPIYVSGAGTLSVVVGIGGAGGAPSTATTVAKNAGALTRIEDGTAQILYPLPTGRCARDVSSLPVVGGAADGGKGGDGAPMVTVPLVAATSTTGVEGGPLGGVAGTGATNGGAGQAAMRRGYAGTTGGAGGGGGSSASFGGSGGADEKHGDQSGAAAATAAGGGAGGGSFFGGAGYGGDPAGGSELGCSGEPSNGPGGGGGGGAGGATPGSGGNGGEGIVIIRWM